MHYFKAYVSLCVSYLSTVGPSSRWDTFSSSDLSDDDDKEIDVKIKPVGRSPIK